MKLVILSPLPVMSLKRLLVGSISLSDDSQLDEENGEDQSDRTSQEIDHSQWTGELVYLLWFISCRKIEDGWNLAKLEFCLGS